MTPLSWHREKMEMTRLPEKVEMARSVADILEASENKKCSLNTSAQMCVLDTDASKLHEMRVHADTVYERGVC